MLSFVLLSAGALAFVGAFVSIPFCCGRRGRESWPNIIALVAALLLAAGILTWPAQAAELSGPAAMAPMGTAPSWWVGLLSALLPDLINAAIVAVLGLAGWALRRWAATSRLKADGYVRAYLERAGQRAIDLGYQVAGATPGQSLADAQLSSIMSTADAYLRDRVPDALRRFGLQKADALTAYLNGLHAERVNWALADAAALVAPPAGRSGPEPVSVYREADGPHAGTIGEDPFPAPWPDGLIPPARG